MSHLKHTRWLAGALATLALTLAAPSAAVAKAPYTVNITMPSIVKLSSVFTLTVDGYSANLSQLTVFHDNVACASTAGLESMHPQAGVSLSKQVVNNYSVTSMFKAVALGNHYWCAYLTSLPPASVPRAHALAPYTTVQ